MAVLGREELTRRAIRALYAQLGIKDAITFLQMSGIVRGDFTKEHRTMPEFSDETTKELIREILISRRMLGPPAVEERREVTVGIKYVTLNPLRST